jgi:hypothetical protein
MSRQITSDEPSGGGGGSTAYYRQLRGSRGLNERRLREYIGLVIRHAGI